MKSDSAMKNARVQRVCALKSPANARRSDASAIGRSAASAVTTMRRSYLNGVRELSQTEALHPAIERAAADTEGRGGAADVAVVTHERLADQQRLDVFETHVLDAPLGRRLQAEVGARDRRAGGHQHSALDHVLQLAHVAWPRVVEQRLHRGWIETADVAT